MKRHQSAEADRQARQGSPHTNQGKSDHCRLDHSNEKRQVPSHHQSGASQRGIAEADGGHAAGITRSEGARRTQHAGSTTVGRASPWNSSPAQQETRPPDGEGRRRDRVWDAASGTNQGKGKGVESEQSRLGQHRRRAPWDQIVDTMEIGEGAAQVTRAALNQN